MPMKFKPSTVQHTKNANGTIKKINVHTYMSGTSTAVLQEAAHASSTTPKKRDKIMKELVRRGVL
jgi:hypothetical protein